MGPIAGTLARHWSRADEPEKALHNLELASAHARQRGAHDEAARYLHDALALEARAAVMSADYYHPDAPTDHPQASGLPPRP